MTDTDNTATGTYTVSVTRADTDLAADTTTTGRVVVGESATGTISPSDDIDWFRVELEAGTTYQIDVEGSETSKGTLEDPKLNGIHDADGNDIAGTTNDDIDSSNLNSRKTFTPTASGAYFIEVKEATGSGIGTYTVTVTRVGEDSDDATLSALSVLDGATELVSSFAAGTTTYTATVENSVTTVTVSATENDSGAEAVITPEDSVTGTTGHQVSLDVGSTTITVTVTAEDDSTQDYTVTVTRREAPEEPEETEGVVTLVSNLDQPDSDQAGISNNIAQEFTTGSNEGGYILSSVDVVSADSEGDEFTASVCTATSGDVPSSTCTDLTSPDSFARGTLTFTALGNIVLAKDTDYFVVFNLGSNTVVFDRVGSDSEDAGAAAGWSIGDSYHDFRNGSWAETSTGKALRIAINGYASEVLLSNLSQTTTFAGSIGGLDGLQAAQAFVTGSAPGTYTLSSIQLDLASAIQIPPDPDSNVTVQLWSSTGGDSPQPGAALATLTHTWNWGSGANTFNAPEDTVLESATTYFVFVSNGHSNTALALKRTLSSSADEAAEGWEVGKRFQRLGSTGSWSSHNQRLRFSVSG